MLAAFDFFDHDKSGQLSPQELHHIPSLAPTLTRMVVILRFALTHPTSQEFHHLRAVHDAAWDEAQSHQARSPPEVTLP